MWHHEPQVTTPVLKLFAELVLNRSQRLQFDASSPNGILLFREASKVICSYGNHILNIEVPKDQIYPLKLKGISICFSMLKAALCGSYVNFGVFRLYGDEALDNALNTFVKLLLSIPQSDLLVSIVCIYFNIKYLKVHQIHLYFYIDVFNRIIQNYRQHIMYCLNIWHRTIWFSFQHWNQEFFYIFFQVSVKALQH